MGCGICDMKCGIQNLNKEYSMMTFVAQLKSYSKGMHLW